MNVFDRDPSSPLVRELRLQARVLELEGQLEIERGARAGLGALLRAARTERDRARAALARLAERLALDLGTELEKREAQLSAAEKAFESSRKL